MSVFTITCGDQRCNANCPFCISKMTQAYRRGASGDKFDWWRCKKAMRRAKSQGVDTALITGFGEPTLAWQQLRGQVIELNKYFSCIELQTNGIKVLDGNYREDWYAWKKDGLNTVVISCVSLDEIVNNDVMHIKNDFSVREAIARLVEWDFTVRVSMQVTKFLNHPKNTYTNDRFRDIIRDARSLGAEQITFRLLGTPDTSEDIAAMSWVKNCAPDPIVASNMMLRSMEAIGANQWGQYHWGGRLYDFEGMSVCVADCLTELPNDEIPRSYIFNGRRLCHSWQYEGSVIF